MKKLFVTLFLLVLAACYPVRSVSVEVSNYPYNRCTWHNPCYYYNGMVFVNEWGWFTPRQYIYYIDYPYYRMHINRHYKHVPRGRPAFVGRKEVERRFRKRN